MEIGLIGTGRMGSAMGERLIDLGHRLTVWNRTAEKAKTLLQRGATPARSPGAVAQATELTLTVLADAKAIEAVYDGPGGLLSGEVIRKLFAHLSTAAPETIRALWAQLHATEGSLLQCPERG